MAVKPLVDGEFRVSIIRDCTWCSWNVLVPGIWSWQFNHRRLFCLRLRVNGELLPSRVLGEATKSFLVNFALEGKQFRSATSNKSLPRKLKINFSALKRKASFLSGFCSVSGKGCEQPGEVLIKFDSCFDKVARRHEKVAKRKKNGQSVGLIYWEIRKWQHADWEWISSGGSCQHVFSSDSDKFNGKFKWRPQCRSTASNVLAQQLKYLFSSTQTWSRLQSAS